VSVAHLPSLRNNIARGALVAHFRPVFDRSSGCLVKRIARILLWVTGIALVVLWLGWVAIRGYLNSTYGQRIASQQLSQMVGTTVEVSSLGVGTSSTSISLRIPDPTPESQSDLIKIGSLEADVSLLNLLTSQVAPTKVTANDIEILLRLDADGKRLSTFPKFAQGGGAFTIPTIQLHNARIRVQQTGHPEFDFGGINGSLKRDGDAYVLTGDADELKWGKWKITGKLNANATEGQFQLDSNDAPLSDVLLRSIPYVPTEVWDHLSASGQTAATITLTFRPGHDLGYRVDLHPKKAMLSFPSAEVSVSDFVGQILVEDGRVTVKDAIMQLAEGVVSINGSCDFKLPNRVITTNVKSNRVNIRQLPDSWGLPKEMEGKLTGSANLQLHIGLDGKMDPRGNGRGELEDAKFAGLNAKIELKLSGRGGRFRFDANK